jgi:hypothetical protein
MAHSPEFYSATWNTSFLELPQGHKAGKVLLATHTKIPTRPTAEVDLKYVEETNELHLQVVESKNQPKMINVVARYAGTALEVCHHQYDPATKKTTDVWYRWDHQHDPKKPPRFSSEVEALCWMVLVASDVGCPGQARADLMRAQKSKFWTKLLDEMKDLQAVASVMLT